MTRVRCAYAIVALLAVSVAHAAPSSEADNAKARVAFEKGAALAEISKWSEALEQFELSASIRSHAQTTYNIAFCERAIGQATRARKHFAQALTQDATAGGNELTVAQRSSVAQYLEELKAKVAHVKIVGPAEALITIDGRPLEVLDGGARVLAGTRAVGPAERLPSSSFVVEVDAGAHEIVLSAPDGRTKIFHATFAPKAVEQLDVDLPPLPTKDPGPQPLTTRGKVGIVVAGAGVVALGVGTFLALSARSKWSDAKEACPSRLSCPNDEALHLSADAQRSANLATTAFAIGGAALVSGAILYFTARPSERTAVTVSTLSGAGAFISFSGAY